MKLNKDKLRMLPAVLYFCVLWFLSSRVVPIDISNSDKLIHVAAYTIMGILIAYGFNIRWENLKELGWAFSIFAPMTGVIDEMHQSFVPGRTASFADVFADIIGCAIGLAIYLILIRLLKRHTIPE